MPSWFVTLEVTIEMEGEDAQEAARKAATFISVATDNLYRKQKELPGGGESRQVSSIIPVETALNEQPDE